MIESLKIELTSSELKAALAEPVAYPENRADAYRRSVASMEVETLAGRLVW